MLFCKFVTFPMLRTRGSLRFDIYRIASLDSNQYMGDSVGDRSARYGKFECGDALLFVNTDLKFANVNAASIHFMLNYLKSQSIRCALPE